MAFKRKLSLGRTGLRPGKRVPASLVLLLKWVLSGPVGWLLAAIVFTNVWPRLPSSIGDHLLGTISGFFMFGAIVGATQSLAIRRFLPRPVSFIVVTGVGILIAMIVNIAVTYGFDHYGRGDPLATGLIFGLSIGVAQWVVLRKLGNRAYWWPIACLVGFTAGSIALQYIPEWTPGWQVFRRIDVVSVTVPSAIAGVTTGILLILGLPAALPMNEGFQRDAS